MNEGMENLKQIEELQEKNEKLGKQVEMLQFACREAATKIKNLEQQVESLTNPLVKMRKGGM
jgi:chaperonin cofactor prefoldin